MGLGNTDHGAHQLEGRLQSRAYDQLEAHIVHLNASALERMNLIFIAKYKKSNIIDWSVFSFHLVFELTLGPRVRCFLLELRACYLIQDL